MNLERVDGIPKRLIVPLISQIFSLKKPVPPALDCQLHDLDGQINQGEELLKSGRSLCPGWLIVQLDILNDQRAALLVQKTSPASPDANLLTIKPSNHNE